MAKKYRMRVVPEAQEEIIDYIDPRSKSFQVLDEDPNEKIISSLVRNDLELAKDRTKKTGRNKKVALKHTMYFSTGKEGFARFIIVASQIVIFAAYLSLIAAMANVFFGLTNDLIVGIPNFTNKLLFLLSPVVFAIVFVWMLFYISIMLIIIVPIMVSREVESVSMWSKMTFIISLLNGIILLVITIAFTILFDVYHWEQYNFMEKISFTPFIVSISVAFAVSLLGYPLLISSARGQKNINKEINEYNNIEANRW